MLRAKLIGTRLEQLLKGLDHRVLQLVHSLGMLFFAFRASRILRSGATRKGPSGRQAQKHRLHPVVVFLADRLVFVIVAARALHG